MPLSRVLSNASEKDSSDEALAIYRQVLTKVDAILEQVFARDAANMRCAKGCSSCCRSGLTVSPVEALSIEEFLQNEMETPSSKLGKPSSERRMNHPDACSFLLENGACSIYEVRPLVCRTQGHALAYPSGWVPVESVVMRVRMAPATREPSNAEINGDAISQLLAEEAQELEIVHCPLNYQEQKPTAASLVLASRIDALLALANRALAGKSRHQHDRKPLEELASKLSGFRAC